MERIPASERTRETLKTLMDGLNCQSCIVTSPSDVPSVTFSRNHR
jgi:hypothetical protein